MASILKNCLISKAARFGIVTLSTALLMACGGGGGSAGATLAGGGSSSNTPTVPTIKLALVDASGAAKTNVTTTSPLIAKATLLDATGKPIVNAIVTFTTGGTLTLLSPSSGAVLTDATGVATASLTPKDLATALAQAGAADTVTATATVGTAPLTASSNYSMGATAITLKLVAPNPSAISLKAYDTTSIKVNVLADGVVYTAQPVSVNFSSPCAGSAKASMPASASTVNGLAQVVYKDQGCASLDTVTASVAGAPSVTADLTIAPPAAASIGFISAVPSDKAIVIQGSGGNGRTETAILTFQALDTFGQPLPNQLVDFTLNLDAVGKVSLQSPSATTGSDGKVTVAVNSGTTPTTFRVLATLHGITPAISTISDTVTVTTGIPVQAAFSLSAETFNIEGWDHDNEKTNINILLADINGNPVADGTPIVFTTDSGAIGSSINGGCVTANGGCSVVFRSQNPRYGSGQLPVGSKRAGLATISVSSATALVTLSGQIGVWLSGSTGAETTYVVASPSSDLTTLGCGPVGLQLLLSDVNHNPLPAGTTLTAANILVVTVGTIYPAAVPNIPPPSLVPSSIPATVGSTHTVAITPPAATCLVGGAHTATGNFDIVIKSPLGVGLVYSFTLTYPIL